MADDSLKSSVARCQCEDEACAPCRALSDLKNADQSDLIELIWVLDYHLARQQKLNLALVELIPSPGLTIANHGVNLG